MTSNLSIHRTRLLTAAAAALLFTVASLPAQQPAPQPAAAPPAQPTAEQTVVITAMTAALTAEAQAVTTATTNLIAAALATPRDNAKIAAANEALATARQAWVTKASQLFAAQQATVIKMGPAATTALVNTAPGSGRAAGRGAGAPAPTLMLTDLPQAVPEKLWNGVDFTGWELVAASSARGGGPQTQYKGEDLFKVVQEDGQPAIWVGGQVLGGLDLVREVGPNYHLHLEIKFVPGPLNNNTGILYHSSGKPTQSGGAWMQSYEFELNVGGMGRLIAISGVQQLTATTTKGAAPNFFNAERPRGQWNTIDLYCFGDKAVHVVNGIPVLELQDLRITDNGVTKPLTSGRIQLQSETSQLFYRNITLETIDKLPVVIVK